MTSNEAFKTRLHFGVLTRKSGKPGDNYWQRTIYVFRVRGVVGQFGAQYIEAFQLCSTLPSPTCHIWLSLATTLGLAPSGLWC